MKSEKCAKALAGMGKKYYLCAAKGTKWLITEKDS
jgi:hypothetical protein